MAVPLFESRCRDFGRHTQVDERLIGRHRAARFELLAVSFLQRRAGEHDGLIGCQRLGNQAGERRQPRLAVFVRERDALTHTLDVCRWMKIVGIIKRPAKRLGKQLADSRFAGTADAHQDDRLCHNDSVRVLAALAAFAFVRFVIAARAEPLAFGVSPIAERLLVGVR